MRMTILKCERDDQDDLDVTLKHGTGIGNAEVDEEGYLTIYGQETADGLFYVILDKELVSAIRSMAHVPYRR